MGIAGDLGLVCLNGAVALGLAYVTYRALASLAGLAQPPPASVGAGNLRFLILVPARNEQDAIAGTVRCLLQLDYPQDRRRVVVLADNCEDSTAMVAAGAGAEVLKRTDASMGGKGAAMRWALERPEVSSGEWDVLLIFDADSRPEPDFLRVVEGALRPGIEVVQGRTVMADTSGMLSRAYGLNARIRNRYWHLARQRLGASAAMTGTGVAISRTALLRVPWNTASLTEDLEYGALLELAGIKADYAFGAVCVTQSPWNFRDSYRQRVRWARGQVGVAQSLAPKLAWTALRGRGPSRLDTALYLAMPSIVPLQAAIAALLAGEAIVADVFFLPAWLLATPLILSVLTTFWAAQRDLPRPSLRDWIGYGVLMVSWIPIGVIGALTVRVFEWHPTPHRQVTEEAAMGTQAE